MFLNRKEPIFIAELSANHLGSLSRQKKLITEAKNCGAHYVKFQHFRPETITTRGEHKDLTVGGGTLWDGANLWDLYEEAAMPWEWTSELISHCNEVGIGWLSTPFDETAVDFLEEFSPECYKISSFEIVDLPLIAKTACTGKPLILSTGMATIEEIDRAVDVALRNGAKEIALLRTNSSYPAPIAEMDLAAISTMISRWSLPTGLSDHSLGNVAAIVAASLGATIFEKHFTLKRSDGGPDAEFSAEPEEFVAYVQGVKVAREAIGTNRFGPSASEKNGLRFRPSLRAVRDINKGETVTEDNVKSVRPSGGLAPEFLESILGKRVTIAIRAGDPLSPNSIENFKP